MKQFFNSVLMASLVLFGLSSCDNQDEEIDVSTTLATKYKSFSKSVSPNTYVIQVASSLVPCWGFVEQDCLKIKEDDNDEWEYFYDTIEGFTFEEGYLYELKVKVEDVENPPADASSLRFILVEEISKTKEESDTSSVSLQYKSFSAAVASNTYVIEVAASLVPCTGVGEQECMVIKGGNNDEWELFYDIIEGFTFEQGYLYELKVKVEDVENPPADASSLRFILVEEISKTKED